MEPEQFYRFMNRALETRDAIRAQWLPLSLEGVLALAGRMVAEAEPGPETYAIGVALADARAWQAARRAVEAAAGGVPQSGLGWEEI